MFKMDEISSADRSIRAVIFMRDDGLFEGRLYRSPVRSAHLYDRPADFEPFVLTGTLVQARMIVHETVGCANTRCIYCQSL